MLLRTLHTAAQEGLVGNDFYWISADTALDKASYNSTTLPWYMAGVVAVGPDVNFSESETDLPNTLHKGSLMLDSVELVHRALAENFGMLEKLDFHEYNEGCTFDTTFIVPYNFRYTLSRILKNTTLFGKTGTIKLDKHGDRIEVSPRLGIYNFVGTNPKVVKAGVWNGRELELSRDLRFYSDFQRKRRTLRIGLIRDEPFVFYDYLNRGQTSCPTSEIQKDDKSTPPCYSGIMISLLGELCRNLNFLCTYHESKDGTSGMYHDGMWTGLLGMLDNDEIDITGIPFAQTLSRLKVAHFSTPILDGGVYMVLNPAEQTQKKGFKIGQFFSSGYSNNGLLFLSPFSFLLWVSIGVVCLSLWVLVWIFDRYSPYGHRGGLVQKLYTCNCEHCMYLPMSKEQRLTLCQYSPLNGVNERLQEMDSLSSLWMMVSSIVQVIPIPSAPRSWSSRLVATSWWLVCLIMVAMYSANLTATMTRSSVSRAVRTVNDLMRSGSGISFGTVNNSVTEHLIRNAEDFTLKEFYRRLSYVDSFDKGVSLARKGSFAFLSEKIPLQYEALKPPCNLYVTQHKIVDYSYSLLYNKRLKDREDIDRGLLLMKENNMLQRLWYNVSHSEDLCDHFNPVDSIKPLELGVMSGVFALAFTMIGVSIMLFTLEVMKGTRISESTFVNRIIGCLRKKDGTNPNGRSSKSITGQKDQTTNGQPETELLQ